MSDNGAHRLPEVAVALPLQPIYRKLVDASEIDIATTNIVPEGSNIQDAEISTTNSSMTQLMADESPQQGVIQNNDIDTATPVRVQVFWPTLQAAPTRDRLIVPPLNFAMVDKGVYRSGYPNRRNFVFLQSLGLKSILYLSPEKHQDLNIGLQNIEFISNNNLRLFHVGLQGQKEPFTVTDENTFREALAVVLDRRNHPLLIHCDKGKHRTGCLVACLRRLQGWSMASIFDEYARYCQGNTHVLDLQFIELVQLPQLEDLDPDRLPHWLLRDHR